MTKKIISIILTGAMCLSVLFTSCDTTSNADATQISLQGLVDSSGSNFDGLPWMSTIEEVTDYFTISSEEQTIINPSEMNGSPYYDVCVQAYFPELDVQGVTTFTFLTSSDDSDSSSTIDDLLQGSESGLTSISVVFELDKESDADDFEEKFTAWYDEVCTSNEFFEFAPDYTDYSEGEGKKVVLSTYSQAYELNGVSICDNFSFSFYDNLESEEDSSSDYEAFFQVNYSFPK